MTPSNTLFVEHFTQAARVAEARPDGTYHLNTLMRIVSEAGGVPVSHLASDWRDHKRMRPRQAFCWIARRFTVHSLGRIGGKINRDHTTVLHGTRRINDVIAKLGIEVASNDPHSWTTALLSVRWPQGRVYIGRKGITDAQILELVKRHSGATTPELQRVLKQVMPKIHKSTLHRRLQVMAEDGLVTRIGEIPEPYRWFAMRPNSEASLVQNKNAPIPNEYAEVQP
jgi:hypothetical protein